MRYIIIILCLFLFISCNTKNKLTDHDYFKSESTSVERLTISDTVISNNKIMYHLKVRFKDFNDSNKVDFENNIIIGNIDIVELFKISESNENKTHSYIKSASINNKSLKKSKIVNNEKKRVPTGLFIIPIVILLLVILFFYIKKRFIFVARS